jgi:osmotically-inducible protein OsmY
MSAYNHELRQRVLDQLDFEPSVDSTHISVTAEDGVITLGGYVTSYAQKVAAERSAWRVKGVKAIAQEIAVRLPAEKKLNDDEVAGRALAILAWNSAIPRDAVRVRVHEGWVTLSGNLHWDYQRRLAEHEVRKLTGVAGITNDIRLTPVTQPSDIKQRIVGALKRHAEVEADAIDIEVLSDGAILIHGQVDNWEERDAVEHAVWSTPGVTRVEDHLQIA